MAGRLRPGAGARGRHSAKITLMSLRFLTASQVVHMHDLLLRRYGGEEGGGHRGSDNEGVEAAVQAVKSSYYEDPRELAAAYAGTNVPAALRCSRFSRRTVCRPGPRMGVELERRRR